MADYWLKDAQKHFYYDQTKLSQSQNEVQKATAKAMGLQYDIDKDYKEISTVLGSSAKGASTILDILDSVKDVKSIFKKVHLLFFSIARLS